MDFFIKSVLSFGFIFFAVVEASAQSTNVQVINTQINKSAIEQLKEKWGASYLNYMNGPALESSPNGASINHYFSIKRKFGNGWAVSATARPDSNFSNGKEGTTMADSYLKVDYPISDNSEGFKISGDIRYYIPQSEESKSAKLSGSIVTRLNINRQFGSLEFSYILIPKVYLNTETVDGQNIFSHGHYISSVYKLNDNLGLDFAVFPSWNLKRNQKESFNNLPIYPGFTLKMSEKAAISPYFEIPLMEARAKDSSVGASLSYTLL